MPQISELKQICSQVRRDIVRMVHGCQSGHPGGSLGCVEFFVSLYFDVMNHNTDFNMNAKEVKKRFSWGNLVEGIDNLIKKQL